MSIVDSGYLEDLQEQIDKMLALLIKAERFYDEIYIDDGLRPYQEKEYKAIQLCIKELEEKRNGN